MNISQIRALLREGRSVVLVEDGQPPLIVTELAFPTREEEVPVRSRPPGAVEDPRHRVSGQDQILERLNKEILALKAQIDQDEGRPA